MKGKRKSIEKDLSTLYELALKVTSSLDIEENYNTFFNALITHKNLNFVGYWLCTEESNLVYVVPSTKSFKQEFSSNLGLKVYLDKNGFIIQKENDPYFNKFLEITNAKEGYFLCYKTGEKGLLILHRLNDTFTAIEASQLNDVIQKFGKFTDALFVQKKLDKEKKVRISTEKALKISEKKFQKTKSYRDILYENMFDAALLYDYESDRVVECNQAALDLFGYTQEEILQLGRYDFVPRFSKHNPSINLHENYVKKHEQEIYQGKEVVNAKAIFLGKDNKELLVKMSIIPTKQKKGEAFIILHDVKEEVTRKKALKKVARKYQEIFDNSYNAIAIYDLEKHALIDVNERSVKMFGFESKEEFLKVEIIDFFAAGEIIKFTVDELKLMAKKYFQYEERLERVIKAKKKNGDTFVLETIILKDYEDDKKHLIVFVNDITEKYNAQKEIEERKKIYQALIENAMEGIDIIEVGKKTDYVKDINGKLLIRNDKMIGYVGESETGIISIEDFWSRLPKYQRNGEESRVIFERLVDEVRTHKIVEYDWQLETTNGELKDFKVVTQLLEINGKRLLIRIYKDITDSNKIQQKIIDSEILYRRLFDNAFEGIVIYSLKEQRIVESNQKFLNLLQVEQIDTPSLLYFSPEYQINGLTSVQYRKIILEGIKKDNMVTFEWIFQRKDGELLVTDIHAFHLKRQNKDQIIFIIKDMTKRREQERLIRENVHKLNKKNRELKQYIESNMSLKNFAYIASHDLKTPLRTIAGFGKLLQTKLTGRINEEEQEFLSFIINSTTNMQKMIKSLLNHSKINSQKITLQTIDVNELLEEIKKDLKVVLEEKRANIYIDDLPEAMEGDKIIIKQLFQNLINNALKFIKENTRPSISIYCEEKRSYWKFFVEDNGIGIDPKFQKKIFRLFQRLHASIEYEGSGIGLATCRKIIELHKGTMGIKSELGEGSTFYFTIKKNINEEE